MKVSDDELNLLRNEYHFAAVVDELIALRKVADAAGKYVRSDAAQGVRPMSNLERMEHDHHVR